MTPSVPCTVTSTDGKGMVFLLSGGQCLTMYSIPSEPRETLFTFFQNLPLLCFHWHLPSRIWKDDPATSLLGLQTRCLLQLQPSLTLFPYSLAFILTTLFPATSGLLAAKANGLSFAECTALASPTWTSPSVEPPHLHSLLLPLSSCTIYSPDHSLWMPLGCLWSSFFGGPSTPVLPEGSSVCSALLGWAVSHFCAIWFLERAMDLDSNTTHWTDSSCITLAKVFSLSQTDDAIYRTDLRRMGTNCNNSKATELGAGT